MLKRDLPGTTSLEEEEQRRAEKLPSRPEGCVQVPSRSIPASCCSALLQPSAAQLPCGLCARCLMVQCAMLRCADVRCPASGGLAGPPLSCCSMLLSHLKQMKSGTEGTEGL